MLWECVWAIIEIVPEEEGQQKKRTDWERESREKRNTKKSNNKFLCGYFFCFFCLYCYGIVLAKIETGQKKFADFIFRRKNLE